MAAATSADLSQSARSLVSLSPAAFAEAFQEAYKRTDDQLRVSHVMRSGATSVSCVVLREPTGKRVIHTANVGDSRAVLCRANGRALRLTVDHKTTLPEEVQRIYNAGGTG